jgi:hypothetical protein
MSILRKPLVLSLHCLDDSCCQHTWCGVVQTLSRNGWSTGAATGHGQLGGSIDAVVRSDTQMVGWDTSEDSSL